MQNVICKCFPLFFVIKYNLNKISFEIKQACVRVPPWSFLLYSIKLFFEFGINNNTYTAPLSDLAFSFTAVSSGREESVCLQNVYKKLQAGNCKRKEPLHC